MDVNMSYLDESIDQLSIKHKEEVKTLEEQFDQAKEIEKNQAAKQIESLQNEVDLLTDELKTQNAENDKLAAKLNDMREQFVQIEEKLCTAEKLLEQKNTETQGAEKDQAES